jgi:hypothetical protein
MQAGSAKEPEEFLISNSQLNTSTTASPFIYFYNRICPIHPRTQTEQVIVRDNKHYTYIMMGLGNVLSFPITRMRIPRINEWASSQFLVYWYMSCVEARIENWITIPIPQHEKVKGRNKYYEPIEFYEIATLGLGCLSPCKNCAV